MAETIDPFHTNVVYGKPLSLKSIELFSASHVRSQNIWNLNRPIRWVVIVLQHSHQRATNGDSGSVNGVAQHVARLLLLCWKRAKKSVQQPGGVGESIRVGRKALRRHFIRTTQSRNTRCPCQRAESRSPRQCRMENTWLCSKQKVLCVGHAGHRRALCVRHTFWHRLSIA